jgi:hypothetical protein
LPISNCQLPISSKAADINWQSEIGNQETAS